MSMLKGHLFRKRPTVESGLNFGTLGTVARDRAATTSNAERVFYNADGVGNDGSQWDAWWADITGWAGVTGHRWLFVEATTKPGTTQADVNAGARPYLCHYSPLDVPNWDYEDGKLAWAIMRLPCRAGRIDGGKLIREREGPLRLYVAKDYTGLADEDGLDFSLGGWWTFDTDGSQLNAPGDTGNWDKTRGDIPMWPHFYQRDKEAFSRPGTTEIGNAAVSYMNLDSAATFDAWDAASSLQFLMGVDPTAFEVAMDKISLGSKYIPVPPVKTDLGGSSVIVPSLADSAVGAVPSAIFTERMLAIRDSVREITGQEASGVPDSSGLSKQAGFGDNKAPRLGLMASEVETSQNTALYYLELRFGAATPTGSVVWTRDFDLEPLLMSIQRVFALQDLSGLKSKTLGARAMVTAGKEAGLIVDDADEKTITDEYQKAAAVQEAGAIQTAGLTAEFGRDGIPTPAQSTVDPVTGLPAVDPPPSGEAKTTTATVLQGAQIAAALAIVVAVAGKTIARDAGIAMLSTLFNIDEAAATAMIGDPNFEAVKPPAPVPFGGPTPVLPTPVV